VADAWRAARIAGTVEADSLLVSVLNLGGNKLDQFLHITGRMEVRRSGQENVVTVRLHLENAVPPGEPPYVAGPHPDLQVAPGTYVGVVAVNLPGATIEGRVVGDDDLVAAGPDGPTLVLGSNLRLAAGASRDVVVRFRLPRDVREVRVEPSARVPPIRWTAPDGSWTDREGHTARW
jgi:hypothetical protein